MITELPYTWHGPVDSAVPVIVLGNSLGTLQSMWSAQVAHLASRFRVLTFDLSGHARDDGAFTFDDLVASTAALLESVGAREVLYCGVSLGGALGVALAARYPPLVSSLVVVNAPIVQSSASFWIERADTVEREGLAALADSLRSRWFTPGVSASVAEPLVADFRALPVAGYAQSCRALAELDLVADAAAVRASTIVVSGSADIAVDAANSRAFADTVPGADLRVVEGAPHMLPVERPEELNRILDGAILALESRVKESMK
jgi:3-oxoadipate enol-lactonase